MLTSEAKTRLESLMRETGEGSKPILFLTEEGDVFTVDKIEYDEDTEVFFIHGTIGEEYVP